MILHGYQTRIPAAGLARRPMARALARHNGRWETVVLRYAERWTAPAGVRSLAMVQGTGENGYPESGQHEYVDGYHAWKVTTSYDSSGVGTDSGYVFQGAFSGDTPSDYCTGSTAPNGTETCWSFDRVDVDVGNFIDGYTGASATAFGLSFPGGAMGTAQPKVFYNVPVVPGTTYIVAGTPTAVVKFIYQP